MLLLLKSPAAGTAAATLGLTLGLSAIPGTTATLGISASLTTPTAVEVNLFGIQDIHLGLVGIPVGFLTRSASFDTQLGMVATGGFGVSPVMDITLGLSGTVGSFLQSTATPGIALGLTGAAVTPSSAILTTVLGLSGAPEVSGGTLTPSATAGLQLSLAGSPVIGASSIVDATLGLTGIPAIKIPNLATEMRLSFTTDEIRLFFRKG